MDENLKDKRSGCAAVACGLIGLMLVLALYVLSIGPVFPQVHVHAKIMKKETFYKFYAPLLWVMYSDTPPGDWLIAYINVWLPDEVIPLKTPGEHRRASKQPKPKLSR